LLEMEHEFLDVLNNSERIGGFLIRLRSLHKEVTSLKFEDHDTCPLSRQVRSVSSSLSVMVQAFRLLQKTRRKINKQYPPDFTYAKRFFLENLHFPFPSTRTLRKIASRSRTEASIISNWFKRMRTDLGYGRLARDHCSGDKLLLRDYLQRVLHPSSPSDDPSVPVQIKDALLLLRHQANEIMGIPTLKKSRNLIAASETDYADPTGLLLCKTQSRHFASSINDGATESIPEISSLFASSTSSFEGLFDPSSFQGCDILWDQNPGFDLHPASSSKCSTTIGSSDLLPLPDQKEIDGSNVGDTSNKDVVSQDVYGTTLGFSNELPSTCLPSFSAPKEAFSATDSQLYSGNGHEFIPSIPAFGGLGLSVSESPLQVWETSSESLFGVHVDNAAFSLTGTTSRSQSDIICHLQNQLLQKDALIHLLLRPASFETAQLY